MYLHALSNLDSLDLLLHHQDFVPVSIKVVARVKHRVVVSDLGLKFHLFLLSQPGTDNLKYLGANDLHSKPDDLVILIREYGTLRDELGNL